jgi:hypothetical protein
LDDEEVYLNKIFIFKIKKLKWLFKMMKKIQIKENNVDEEQNEEHASGEGFVE